MFGELGNLTKLFSQAGQIRDRLATLQREARESRVIGTAGGGLVRVEVNGALEVLSCAIDPALIERQDRELLEDLVRTATNQALGQLRTLQGERLSSLLGGLEIPGLQEGLEALGKLGPGDRPS